jgi:hypothetical protein
MDPLEETIEETPDAIAAAVENRFAKLISAGREITCPGCGNAARQVSFAGRTFFQCEPCADAEEQKRHRSERITRCLATWDALCPIDFRTPLDPLRLHQAIVPALALTGLEGSALIGESGSGKTRVAWMLLRRAAIAGHSVYAVSHVSFRSASSLRHDHDRFVADTARDTLSRAHNAQILLIDDIGKGTPTESADESFFELLSARRDNKLVTHWTANAGSRWLKSRFGRDKGPAILQRLRDLCAGHVFNTNPGLE